jgi:hypothetical protein
VAVSSIVRTSASIVTLSRLLAIVALRIGQGRAKIIVILFIALSRLAISSIISLFGIVWIRIAYIRYIIEVAKLNT